MVTGDHDERARLQSRSEWLREMESGKPVPPSCAIQPIRAARLRYDRHRTTRHERVVLAFIDLDTGEEVDAFFNVSVTKRNGGRYRKGKGGQFSPQPRSAFRAWWIQVVGTPPRRWARVHYELHRLRAFTFTADLIEGKREDGTVYLQARNVRRVDSTATAQGLHTVDTATAREPPCTSIQREAAPILQFSPATTAHALP